MAARADRARAGRSDPSAGCSAAGHHPRSAGPRVADADLRHGHPRLGMRRAAGRGRRPRGADDPRHGEGGPSARDPAQPASGAGARKVSRGAGNVAAAGTVLPQPVASGAVARRGV